MRRRPAHIMILTGEPSGDFHGALLARALTKLMPGCRISGIGGPAMAGQGAQIFFPIERLSAMGLIQVAKQFSSIRSAFSTFRQHLKTDRPDVVVLIDYPGFNLRAARYIKDNTQIPVCYYIAPKVWAWNARRLKKIKAFTDHVALIFPFEQRLYKRHGIPATYVGNPLMDEYPVPLEPAGAIRDGKGPVIGLLPGSRSSEITNLLPVMLDAAALILNRSPETRFLVSSGTAVHEPLIRDFVLNHRTADQVTIVKGRVRQVFSQSDMLVAASGTVTLEAALCTVPTVIVYKMSSLTYGLGRLLVKVKYAGLANLIMDRQVMPELLQDRASPEQVAAACSAMLDHLEPHRHSLEKVRQRLGRPGAPDRTAKIIVHLMAKDRIDN